MTGILSLDTLLASDDPIYVRNNTKAGVGGIGNVMLTVVHQNRAHPVTIPRTRAPFPLSRFLPKKVISDSWDIRSMIAKEVLLLIDPKVAERELADPKVAADLQRALRSVGMQGFVPFGPIDTQMPEKVVKHTGSHDDVDPRVLSIVARIDDKDMSTEEALSELDLIRDEIEESSLEFLSTNASGSVAKWAQDSLTVEDPEISIDDDPSDEDEDPEEDPEEDPDDFFAGTTTEEAAAPAPKKTKKKPKSKKRRR